MFLYPLWVRIWHVFNAILILILIFTGISIFSPGRESSFFIMQLSKAQLLHKVSSIILIITYTVFLAGNIFTDNGRYYTISEPNFFNALLKQFRYYVYGKFKHDKNPFPVTPENKFNPLQKLSYITIMYVALPLVITSGVGLLLPEPVIKKLLGSDGYKVVDIIHIVMALLISIFLLIHIYLGAIASKPTAGLRGIITGYSEPDEE